MSLDHEAIRKAYPSIVNLDDSFKTYGLDKDGNKVNLVQSKIDTARTELDKLKYQVVRLRAYPSIGDQLDNLYRDILADKLDSTGEFVKAIKAVKDANPKP